MDLDATTPEQRAEAALGVVAYAGRFEVTGEEVRHSIFTAVNPNRVGDTQVRRITLCRRRPDADLAARQAGQSFPHPLAARRQDVGIPLVAAGGAAGPVPAGQIAGRHARSTAMTRHTTDSRQAAEMAVQGGDHQARGILAEKPVAARREGTRLLAHRPRRLRSLPAGRSGLARAHQRRAAEKPPASRPAPRRCGPLFVPETFQPWRLHWQTTATRTPPTASSGSCGRPRTASARCWTTKTPPPPCAPRPRGCARCAWRATRRKPRPPRRRRR